MMHSPPEDSVQNWQNCPIFINSNFKTTTIFVMKDSARVPKTVFRIAANREYITKEYRTIKYLKGFSGIANYIPVPVSLDKRSKRPISCYEYIKGEFFVSRRKARRSLFQNCLIRICPFLRELASISIPEFLRNSGAGLDSKLSYLNSASNKNSSLGEVVKLVTMTSEHLKNTGISKIIVHGDLNFSNILMLPTGTKVIDWEFVTTGYPLTDFVHFVLSSLNNVPLIDRGSFFLNILNNGALSESLVVAMSMLLDSRLSEKDIRSLLCQAVFYYYFKELYYKLENLALIVPTLTAIYSLDLKKIDAMATFSFKNCFSDKWS